LNDARTTLTDDAGARAGVGPPPCGPAARDLMSFTWAGGIAAPGVAGDGLPRPELLAFLAHFVGQRVLLDEFRRGFDEAEELDEVFAVDEQPGLAYVAAALVALTFHQDKVVVAVLRPLHLCGVRARAHGHEELLEKDLVLVG
jgi:hypothetical protein